MDGSGIGVTLASTCLFLLRWRRSLSKIANACRNVSAEGCFSSTPATHMASRFAMHPPHSDDRHGIFSLTINAERARRDIEVANRNGHRLVGYWHTHPQSVPELSCTDISSFRELAQLNPETLPMPLAVIVGYSRSTDGIRAWSIRPSGILRAETMLLQDDLSHRLKAPKR